MALVACGEACLELMLVLMLTLILILMLVFDQEAGLSRYLSCSRSYQRRVKVLMQRNGCKQQKAMRVGFAVSIPSLIVSIPNSAIPDSAIHAIDWFLVVEAAEDKSADHN